MISFFVILEIILYAFICFYPRRHGSQFFESYLVTFYCIFGRFVEMTPITKSEILGRLEPHGPYCLRRPC